ncbi:hypothetical protein BCR44DRAFT_1025587 [Catenaria anguillulae PL171]|uniref:Letm1 RBD domain-containing protein n=1 Tax=Catenaria anguillulae PL171 TaxID=765915 RepID=A0A1Y2HT45_9FUNG|nr:hypothetical protein BCR44DRAFT_1025587 [Catenaria anguillulae PL171]
MPDTRPSQHASPATARKTHPGWEHFRRIDPLGYSPYTEFGKIDRPTLQHFCRIMSISAIGPRPMLARRLDAHLTHLAKDDALLVREGIEGLTKEELEVALEQRGFCTAGGRPMADMQAALRRWLAMTQDRDVTRLQWVVSRAVVKPWSSKVKQDAVSLPTSVSSDAPASAVNEGRQ